MFENDGHVADCSITDCSITDCSRSQTAAGRRLQQVADCSGCTKTSFHLRFFVWDNRLCFYFQQVIFAVCMSWLSILPHPYLRATPSFTPPPPQSPDTLLLSPLPPLQLWRLSLALVVTVFISGILEGLRRDETHSFVGGVKKEKRKKKKGPVQYSTLSAVP